MIQSCRRSIVVARFWVRLHNSTVKQQRKQQMDARTSLNRNVSTQNFCICAFSSIVKIRLYSIPVFCFMDSLIIVLVVVVAASQILSDIFLNGKTCILLLWCWKCSIGIVYLFIFLRRLFFVVVVFVGLVQFIAP